MLMRKATWTNLTGDAIFQFPADDEGMQPHGRLASSDELLGVVDSISRRIDDLARELNCLGHFGDDDDTPRAA